MKADNKIDTFIQNNFATQQVGEFFTLNNYKFVEVPLIEDSIIFETKSSGELLSHTYNFESPDGRKVTVRPEFTSSIIQSLINNKITIPQRFYYSGPVLRRDEFGKQNQFNQIGCELLGKSSLNADMEILNLSISALEQLGLTNLEIILNDTQIINNLIKEINLPTTTKKFLIEKISSYTNEKQMETIYKNSNITNTTQNRKNENSEKISKYLSKKNRNEIKKYLSKLPLGSRTPDEISARFFERNNTNNKNIYQKIINIYEDLSSLGKIPLKSLDSVNKIFNKYELTINSLDYLHSLKKIIETFDSKFNVFINFDLITGINYYDQLIFTINDPSTNVCIGSGGRYNSLATNLGSKNPINACGFAYNIDLISKLLANNKLNNIKIKEPILIAAKNEESLQSMYSIGEELKKAGTIIEIYLDTFKIETIKKYAQNKNITQCLIVEKNKKVTHYDFKK